MLLIKSRKFSSNSSLPKASIILSIVFYQLWYSANAEIVFFFSLSLFSENIVNYTDKPIGEYMFVSGENLILDAVNFYILFLNIPEPVLLMLYLGLSLLFS
jgi:hypothetical protein